MDVVGALVHLARWYEMRRVLRGRWTPRLEALRWRGLPLRQALSWRGALGGRRGAPAWNGVPTQGLDRWQPPLTEGERRVLEHPLLAAFGRADEVAPGEVLYDLMRWPRLLARHLKYRGDDGRIQPVLGRLYSEVNRLLRGLGVDYWLDWGTLLGLHREGGGLLPGDHDVDFGVLAGDHGRIWEARHRLPRGFRMCDASYRYGSPKLYVSLEDWKADLYFYTPRGESLQCFGDTDAPCCLEPFPARLVLPVREAEFLGETTRIPADPAAYLARRYGYTGRDAVRDPATGYWRRRA